MDAETKEIFKLLKVIKSQLKYIKERMLKRDTFLIKKEGIAQKL